MKTLNRISFALSLSVLISLGLLGCNRTGSKQVQLAFVTNNVADFRTIARKGCEKAEKDIPNVKVEFRIPADGTAAEQKRIVDDLLSWRRLEWQSVPLIQ